MEGKTKLTTIFLKYFLFSIRLNWTFELLFLTVGKLHIVGIIWLLMTLSTSFVVFYGTYLWASHRKSTGFRLSDRKIS